MNQVVKIDKYDPKFPQIYQGEKERLTEILGSTNTDFEIEHIGSTAIPGLDSKGVVDIMIILEDFSKKDRVLSALNNSGLYHKETAGSKGRIFLSDAPLDTNIVRFHYHIVAKGSEDHKKPIRFRDELIKYPDKAREYLKLKKELAQRAKSPRDYLEGKNNFIKQVLEEK